MKQLLLIWNKICKFAWGGFCLFQISLNKEKILWEQVCLVLDNWNPLSILPLVLFTSVSSNIQVAPALPCNYAFYFALILRIKSFSGNVAQAFLLSIIFFILKVHLTIAWPDFAWLYGQRAMVNARTVAPIFQSVLYRECDTEQCCSRFALLLQRQKQ